MEQKNGNYKKYVSKNPLMQRVTSNFLSEVTSIVERLEVQTILDAGCGEGFVISRLAGKNMVGLDISMSALDIARAHNPDTPFAVGDIYSMPFKPESFDLVFALEVMEHLHDPEKAMLEMGRMSKRYCLLSVPNEPYFRIMDVLRGKNLSRLGNDIEHLQNWTDGGFVRLLSGHFNVLEVRRPFPWTMVLCEKKQVANKANVRSYIGSEAGLS